MPGPIMMKPQLPAGADPQQASSEDSLFRTLLRKAAGAAQTLGIDDPSGVMGVGSPLTTIGPKAIPLHAGREYMNQVAKSSIDDLIQGANKFGNLSMPSRTIVGKAVADPYVQGAAATRLEGMIHPEQKVLGAQDLSNPAMKVLIQRLADAFLPDYLK